MKRFLIFLFFFPIIIPASAQTSVRNDELKFDADYYLMRQEFNKALDLYLREHASDRLTEVLQLRGILADDEAAEVERRIAEAWRTWKTDSE